MAHDHAHGGNAYYLDQLCTLGACGAVGGVAVMMYAFKTPPPVSEPRLYYILAPQFFMPVLYGGITLLALVLIRGAALWREAGQKGAESCGHDHGPDDHGHDHSWTPAKYGVLMLPVILFFLNLPNSSFKSEMFNFDANQLDGPVAAVADKGTVELAFKELSNAALTQSQRDYFEGKVGVLRGMFSPLRNDKEFTLYRVKMTCCAADAIPLEVRIVCPENVTGYTSKDWVEVEGQIQFVKVKDREKYLPVMLLKSPDAVKKIPPQPEYDY